VTGFHKRKVSRQEKAETIAKELARQTRIEDRKQVCITGSMRMYNTDRRIRYQLRVPVGV
jgi:hypothetical protein